MENLRDVGGEGEDEAVEFLKKKGFRLLHSNYLIRGGEIDLVMEDGKFLVFVEVKKRRSNSYGNPLESITYGKQKKMIKAAMMYIQSYGIKNKMIRFDVVGISEKGVVHIPNAFEASASYYY